MYTKRSRMMCAAAKKSMQLFSSVCIAYSVSVTPAFAMSGEALAKAQQMLQTVNKAYIWLCSILIFGAVLSIASYAYSFFFVSDNRDSEKKLTAAKKRMVTVCIACVVMGLIPIGITFGRDLAKATAWQPVKDRPGNHIIQPASEEHLFEVDGGEGDG